MQPGQTISPNTEQPSQEQTAPGTAPPPPQAPAPIPVPEEQIPAQAQAEPTASWQYEGDSSQAESYQEAEAAAIKPISWTASEYISHRKGPAWFMLLGVGLFLLIALVYLLTKDVVAAVGVGVAGISLAAFSVRPPRVLEYAITEKGIQIGQRFHSFSEFKSFSIIDDGALPSVLLMPLKRFLPPITLFCEPQAADDIISTLSAYLPHESKKPDAVDKLMSNLRF